MMLSQVLLTNIHIIYFYTSLQILSLKAEGFKRLFFVTLFFFIFKILCVQVLCLHVCLAPYICSAQGGQKRALDPCRWNDRWL